MAQVIAALVRRFARSESGAELIEFGLTLPLLLLVLIGIIEAGLLFQQYEVVTNAAREGARIAVLPTYSATPAIRTANVTARVNQYLVASGLTGPATTTVATPPPVPVSTGCVTTVLVTVQYDHSISFLRRILRNFGNTVPDSITLRSRSQMRTENSAGTCS
jgi:Flp pilus assembly protein TadG